MIDVLFLLSSTCLRANAYVTARCGHTTRKGYTMTENSNNTFPPTMNQKDADRALLNRMLDLEYTPYKHRIDNKYGFQNASFKVKELEKIEGSYAYWTCTCNYCGSEFSLRSCEFDRKFCSTSCAKFQQSVSTHLGKKFGCLTIKSLNPQQHPTKGRLCTVECDCGQVHEKIMNNVVRSKKAMESCGPTCGLKDTNAKYLGSKIGRLNIKKIIPPEVVDGIKKSERFLCVCDCGNVSTPESKSVLAGTTTSCGCYHKSVLSRKKGDKNPNWRGGATVENQLARTSSEKWAWVKAVHSLSNYTCQCCGYRNARGSHLHAHHIQNFASNIALRCAVENGITLCCDCHNDFHAKFDRVDNDAEQLQLYIDKYKPMSPREYDDSKPIVIEPAIDISIDFHINNGVLEKVETHSGGILKSRHCNKPTLYFASDDRLWFTDNLLSGIIYSISYFTGDEQARVVKSYLSEDASSLIFELDAVLSLKAADVLGQPGAILTGITCSIGGDENRTIIFAPISPELPSDSSPV
jgi:hypothetical protein